ncbi:1-deoxy-D-xylulose-5-phosphate reductoisomerase [Cryobacterium sp. TMT1-21]|uniref:1-deoxy-D-xylulose 5-phosphate reductoisomerase n=1 Tax=Cryobacterium shii TaxID=1259235 RepID=A0AAQ2C779_9MICO|nr:MULTISPECIES: 1-deoxy-D-xylulose-5-phosphate reductoisomerase [Cryobacterium]TFC50143.1 1-deoxy-D-xylulose-5-phosphate reductoisomerase [Cryobacterium shii]TFC82495.1 1-deoxy-D-xylulose-5-phosphate reductoisomerase [Cryobacterium sp. TmT2-59]TFD12159.1 1-deoxy-D-xylulose-5-phosphate reductoisomerase [Cryobacterium sp. TMT1-21]TFD19688.1 1-deoxy-D-xylulose-5-phosphate reductoisomerase [Cryobacterium sp. TMT4-10]TFD20641.1 1-deoxy-D-xylulose-5-phosphate reductoisomerase [Cryobacterium sp. TMT
MRRRVVILGSTGSIGTQALDVIKRNPSWFEVVGLSAGTNRTMLDEQAAEFEVEHTALGADEAEQLVRDVEADVVLNGITGSVGLGPTLAALRAGRTLALANKESLIVGGDLVKSLAAPGQIVPVDSEHSAIAQALRSGTAREVRRLVLTASGGPFRGRSRGQLAGVTPAEALAHPTWDMGPVVTTNSATLVNKGLEVIEAHLLFDVGYEHIDVVVHPQSVVHSMVEFIDGSTIAQASPPDMRLPISLGLFWPNRVSAVGVPIDWTTPHSWTFEPLDTAAFPAVDLAKQVGRAGSTYPAVFNAANEQAVAAFHAGAIGFLGIVDTIQRVVEAHEQDGPLTRESLAAAEVWARAAADALIAG